MFSFFINPIKNTLSFNIGNNFKAALILIIELFLSFPNVLKSDLSINFFWPILKYLSIYLEWSLANTLGIKHDKFIPFRSLDSYLNIFSTSLLHNSITPSFPLSPLAIMIHVSLLNKILLKLLFIGST